MSFPEPFGFLRHALRPLLLAAMDIESVRSFCLSLPHVDEKVQWGNDLLFRIGEKMFAVVSLEPASDHCMSFKCTPEKFAELVEQEGIFPAPYVARYHWVALKRFDALPERDLKQLLRTAYELVHEKLPAKIKRQLEKKAPAVSTKKRSRR
jgi:predicted DNA-binding protein (MmcQ/YjbR family)